MSIENKNQIEEQIQGQSLGALYIVATPIGNLKDITYRAIEILQQVDLILVEDTRNAIKLLQHYGVKKPMKAVHEHNEDNLAQTLVEKISSGALIALISDAGTPLVSDPGFRVVQAAQAAGFQPIVIPGACAAIAALSIAGLPTDRFAFEGFLPAKQAARELRLKALKTETRTLIFYEAKHRILAFLGSLQAVFGDKRKIVVARELTKKFETVYAGYIEEIISALSSDALAQKGEFVVMAHGAKQVDGEIDVDQTLIPLLAELSVSKASKLTAKITGANKNLIYQRALDLQQNQTKS